MTATMTDVARVNGVPLHDPGERIDAATLRQRACSELLRQAARRDGFDDASSGDAIERWLDCALVADEPTEEACRRHFAAHRARYDRGERLALRHILFAVTPGVDVNALRRRAEARLLELRCAAPESDAFENAAREFSNCPSGAKGGTLGWVTRDECAGEFAREVFGQETVGVLPRLVHSRFGFHVVEIVARETAHETTYEEVAGAVRYELRRQTWVNALRDTLQELASQAALDGVTLDATDTPAATQG